MSNIEAISPIAPGVKYQSKRKRITSTSRSVCTAAKYHE
jgi:hypothetical protein